MNINSELLIEKEIQAAIDVKTDLISNHQIIAQINTLANLITRALREGGKVIFAGNGGSFADAQHLSAEFTARFLIDREPLASVALGTNSSCMSAIANDFGYDQVFSRELAALAKKGDVFIPISTSGNSSNILEALNIAARIGAVSVGLTGKFGGMMASRCECIQVPSVDTARIQECHILIGHILCGLVESNYFSNN